MSLEGRLCWWLVGQDLYICDIGQEHETIFETIGLASTAWLLSGHPVCRASSSYHCRANVCLLQEISCAFDNNQVILDALLMTVERDSTRKHR